MIVWVFVIALLITKAVHDGRIDHEFAKQGLVSPRLEKKYGSADGARAATGRYGLLDHISDAWSDHWRRRTETVRAARDAKPVDPSEPVRWRNRREAAKKAVDADGPAPDAKPTPDQQTAPEPDAQQTTPDGTGPDGTPTDQGATPDADAPGQSSPRHAAPDDGTEGFGWYCEYCGESEDGLSREVSTERRTAHQSTCPNRPASTPEQHNPEGGTMTAPTGEAVNYETHVAELDAEIAEMQKQVDLAQAAMKSLEEAKTSIDAMQQGYQATAEAAQSKLDHLTALNLDQTTLGHAATAVDAMPPNAVNTMFDQLEGMESEVKSRLEQAGTALASMEAERAHVVAEHGDHAAHVAGSLGGDARYLDSGAGTQPTSGPAPQHATASN